MLFLLGLPACVHPTNDRATEADCAQLNDHIVDLELGPVEGAHAAHRQAHREQLLATTGPFLAQCPQRPRSEVQCALGALTLDAVAACTPEEVGQ